MVCPRSCSEKQSRNSTSPVKNWSSWPRYIVYSLQAFDAHNRHIRIQVFGTVAPEYGLNIMRSGKPPSDFGIINQHGLNRKASESPFIETSVQFVDVILQHIFDSIKQSLKRLQLDYIDLLQCALNLEWETMAVCSVIDLGHRFDNTTPIEETVRNGLLEVLN